MSNVIEFPAQQRAWEEAQRLAEAERERHKPRHVKIECLYRGGITGRYSGLLSDPPSVFRIRVERSEWNGRSYNGHFIANRNRMPLAEPLVDEYGRVSVYVDELPVP